MRDKDNSNYLSTRKLCNNIYKITGLTRSNTFNFLKLINCGLIHGVSEEALDSDTKLKNVDIEIPFIGLMHINTEDMTATIELEDEFKKDINSAITSGESPLLSYMESALIKSVNERYNSLM